MNKKFYLKMACFAFLGLTLTACSDDDDDVVTRTTPFAVVLDMPLDVNSPVLDNATATLTNVATQQTYTASSFSNLGEQYADTLIVPEGVYNISVSGSITYALDDSTSVSANVRSTSESVSISSTTQGTPSKNLALSVYRAQDGLLITEIFFTGTLTPEGKQYSDDQYIKIGNNSDSTLYLDGLAFVESDFQTNMKYDYNPDIMSKAMTIDAIYVFPGSGQDYPIAPGQEVVVAVNAKNHLEFNSQSIDLSTADFEIYDESENPSFVDEDNPSVPNLINWYDYSYSYFIMHNRGAKAYAIARPTVDMQTFLSNYHYTYTYVFSYGQYVFDMDGDAYKLPNEWVIDAVNCSVHDEWEWNVTAANLDAGWTYCAYTNSDKARYGKAVVRKKENGKWLDTNNSTNDFTPEAQPTLLSAQ